MKRIIALILVLTLTGALTACSGSSSAGSSSGSAISRNTGTQEKAAETKKASEAKAADTEKEKAAEADKPADADETDKPADETEKAEKSGSSGGLDLTLPTFNAKPIEPVTVIPVTMPDITIPTFTATPITAGDVTVMVPSVDVEISEVKVASVYDSTYTVPSLSVTIPEFDAPELEDMFVSMVEGLDLSLQEQYAKMTTEEFVKAVSIQLDLIDAFMKAFEAAGISVAIDPLSGTIPIDASLLYDVDAYEMTPEGKAGFKQIFEVYYSVITQEQFRDVIDRIVIEGHTDTQASYEYNQELSEKRADGVRTFLLSDECGFEDTAYLESLLTAVGRSYDDPVYAADGSVDMDASRRVEIHFTLKLD